MNRWHAITELRLTAAAVSVSKSDYRAATLTSEAGLGMGAHLELDTSG